jgi:hypothetical protein
MSKEWFSFLTIFCADFRVSVRTAKQRCKNWFLDTCRYVMRTSIFCLHENWWFWIPSSIIVWSEYSYLASDIISLSKSNITVGWTVTLKIKFENFSKDQVVQAQFKSYKKA